MSGGVTSRGASKFKICGKCAVIMQTCELLRKLRSFLDFAINSAIAESLNSEGTAPWRQGPVESSSESLSPTRGGFEAQP